MSINYSPKLNQTPTGLEPFISGEVHTVGIVGVATVMANTVKLVGVPRKDMPSSISIPGYVEVTTSSPGSGQFYVDYINGYITFNPSAEGNSVSVSYYSKGSEIDAVDVNELQEPVGIALGIDGSVTPNILLFGVAFATNPSGTLPQTDIDTHTGIVITATTSVSVTIPTPTNVQAGRFFTVLNKATSTNNILVNGNNVVIGFGATFLWDGVAWDLISPVASTSGFPVVSTDPVSPFLGQTWFNSTSSQAIMYNGTTNVILG